ncbi:transposase domain-containing protein [Streptomyces zaomyceticus]|nr:transposase domain-containing protein [Streptomyces zaomyceticus]
MASSWRGGGPGCRSRIGILTKVFTPELVDAAVAKHGRVEQRRRLLPARLVVYFVLALCLFARESYEEVMRMLISGIPGSRASMRRSRRLEGRCPEPQTLSVETPPQRARQLIEALKPHSALVLQQDFGV